MSCLKTILLAGVVVTRAYFGRLMAAVVFDATAVSGVIFSAVR